jgi:DNA-binding winged helix-turn-helix (wHTH) protein
VIYLFDEFELEANLFELRHRGTPVGIQRKALDLLLYLIRHRDRVVARSELIERVWGGSAITDNAIAQAVSALRAVVRRGRAIHTVRGRGFRFVLPVREKGGDSEKDKPRNGRRDDIEPAVSLLVEPTTRAEVDVALGPFAEARRIVIDAAHGRGTSFGTLVEAASTCTAKFPSWGAGDDLANAVATIRAAAIEPLVLVILRVERADMSSLLFFSRARHLLTGGPVAVVMTCEAGALVGEDAVGALLRVIGSEATARPERPSGITGVRAKDVGLMRSPLAST